MRGLLVGRDVYCYYFRTITTHNLRRGKPPTLTRQNKKRIRVISPCYNEAVGIHAFYESLKQVLAGLPHYQFEIVFIDDGSTDQTLSVLNALAANKSDVLVYSLSRNFGHQAALLAGIDTVPGNIDALIMMDSDLQHPPACIPEMITAWESGYEIVSMVRRKDKKTTHKKRLTSWLYYKFLRRASGLEIVSGAADFCLLGTSALSGLKAMPERDLFLRGAIAWIGFSRKLIEFDVHQRQHGSSKYTFAKMLKLARQGFFGFSAAPIRLTIRLGVGLTCIAALYLLYAVIMYANNGTVKGWTSLIAIVVFFGGLNLFTLGVIGEYIARTFDEVKRRPRYLFKQVPALKQSEDIVI